MNDNNTRFSGLERRLEQRRKVPDRRVLIRYEPEKELRRQGNGRRQSEREDIWSRKRD
jgi:hypothetical protein